MIEANMMFANSIISRYVGDDKLKVLEAIRKAYTIKDRRTTEILKVLRRYNSEWLTQSELLSDQMLSAGNRGELGNGE